MKQENIDVEVLPDAFLEENKPKIEKLDKVPCQFVVKQVVNGETLTYSCRDMSEGICRCKEVCRYHFRKLKQDNVYRINKGIDIPEDTSLAMRYKINNISVKLNDLPKDLNSQEVKQ
jgi:hypothetical protein